MNNFYTNTKQWGNNILVRGIKDGKRYTSREKFQPTLFQNTNKSSNFKSLSGEPLQANKFSNIYDAKEFVKRYKDVHNMKLYGNEAYQFQWIAECYPNVIEYDPSLIRTLTVDAETTVNFGFPDCFNPLEEVTLIACKNRVTKHIVTFGTLEYTKDREDITYVKCKSETDLFNKFLAWWESDYPDIITGWNTANFDMPYIVERIKRVLGEDAVNRLSPFGIVRTREYEEMGQNKLDVDVFGVAHLDYLELYKKFTYTKPESYKLDYIGEIELGMNKLENPYATFKEFYENDPQNFVRYNAIDTDIVDGLEGKLKLIELAISLAFMAKINFDDVFSPVKMWDTIIYNYLIEQGIVVPFKEGYGDSKSIEGAFVKEPLAGLYRMIASFDAASLYPHIIMALNMSPETICNTMVDVNVQEMLAGDRTKVVDGFSLAPNGSMYDMSKKGFLPALMSYYYNQRKVEKKKMLALKQELENTRDSISAAEVRVLENKIATSNSLQMALKIALNSAYGALAQKGFRFYDTRIAEGITMGGQLIIQNAEHAANDFLQGILKTKKDYVIAVDTDSVVGDTEIYINGAKTTIAEFYNSCDGNFIRRDIENQDFVKECSGVVSPSVNSNLVLEDKPVKYVMKHRVKKTMFKITVGGKSVTVTEDHSVMVLRDGKLISVNPNEIAPDTDSLVCLGDK